MKILLKVLFWVVLYGVVVVGGASIINKVHPEESTLSYVVLITSFVVVGLAGTLIVVACVKLWLWIDNL